MTALPQAQAIPTRALPAQAAGTEGVPLEFVAWPWYSSMMLLNNTAIPRRTALFGYIAGDPVPGNVAPAPVASLMHTNMVTPSAMPRPTTFTVQGLRVVMSPLGYTPNPAVSDNTEGTANENIDQVDAFVRFLYSTFLTFDLGTKNYVEIPLHMAPAQTGVGGVAATSVHANAAIVYQTRVALHSKGVGYTFRTGRQPVLWYSQPFDVVISCQFATAPTIIADDDKLVTVILDGVHGREIQ